MDAYDLELYGPTVKHEDLLQDLLLPKESCREEEQLQEEVSQGRTSKPLVCKLWQDDSFFLAAKSSSDQCEDFTRQRASDYSLPKNVADRVASQVEDSIHQVNESSEFLIPKHDREQNVAQFHKHEVVLGGLIARGGFADIYQVKSFKPCSCQQTLTSSQQSARDKILATATTADDNDSSSLSTSSAPKYVVKHLQSRLIESPKAFKSASVDLAYEAQILASVQHPNIVTLRGWSSHGTRGCTAGHDGFFMILDRLYETLEQRVQNKWSKQIKITSGDLPFLLKERLKVLTDIGSALTYLHRQGILYRDLKTNNLAFDREGKIQLFDFGLAKEVFPTSRGLAENDTFHITGGVGTLRYMAPEVANHQPYNFKADVYGFTMIMYETLALKKPFEKYTESMMRERVHDVMEGGERPKLKTLIKQSSCTANFPSDIFKLIADGWSQDIAKRPTMKEVYQTLKVLLLELELPTPSAFSTNSRLLTGRRILQRRGSIKDLFADTFRSNKNLVDKGVDNGKGSAVQGGGVRRKIGRSSSSKF